MQHELLTYKEIAAETGITSGALRKRLSKGTMPQPDLRHGDTPVWYADTIRPWMATARPGDRQHVKRTRP